jgi:ferredoxin-NADP reductase
MARAAVQRRLTWLPATVVDNRAETSRVHRLIFDVPGWQGHVPGQHLDIRLTAEDGYTAQRSYSIASPPEEPHLHLLVEQLPEGEVSPYLTEETRPDDVLELRGPVGRFFVWSAADDPEGTRPVQLVAGGSGVAPFVAMLDQHRRAGSATPVRLLYSTRTLDDVLAPATLEPYATLTLTRQTPAGWQGETGRIDAALLARHLAPHHRSLQYFVCSREETVQAVRSSLAELDVPADRVHSEQFGMV